MTRFFGVQDDVDEPYMIANAFVKMLKIFLGTPAEMFLTRHYRIIQATKIHHNAEPTAGSVRT